MIFADTLRDAVDRENRPLGEAGVAEVLQGKLHLSAEELVAAVREALGTRAANPDRYLVANLDGQTHNGLTVGTGRVDSSVRPEVAGMAELADARLRA